MCCFLVHRYWNKGVTAKEALEFYNERRTADKKGLNIPSQVRFLFYYEETITKNINLNAEIVLKNIKMHTAPA